MAVNWALVPSSVQLRVPSVLPGTKQIALNESFSGYDIAVCYEGGWTRGTGQRAGRRERPRPQEYNALAQGSKPLGSRSLAGRSAQRAWGLPCMLGDEASEIGRAAKPDPFGNITHAHFRENQQAARGMKLPFGQQCGRRFSGLRLADACQMGRRYIQCCGMICHCGASIKILTNALAVGL